MGTINTVQGSILPEKLGITIMHEHVFADLADVFYTAPQDPELRKYENSPVTMEILGLLRRNPSLTKQNCFINDEILSQKELKYFKNQLKNKTVIAIFIIVKILFKKKN